MPPTRSRPRSKLCGKAMTLAATHEPVTHAVGALVTAAGGSAAALEQALAEAEQIATRRRDRPDLHLGAAFIELALHDLSRGLRQPAAV